MDNIEGPEQRGDRLRPSQRVDATWESARDIAHDLNNNLAIISSSFELLKRQIAGMGSQIERGENDLDRFINAGLQASHRAATLAHHLGASMRQEPLDQKACTYDQASKQ